MATNSARFAVVVAGLVGLSGSSLASAEPTPRPIAVAIPTGARPGPSNKPRTPEAPRLATAAKPAPTGTPPAPAHPAAGARPGFPAVPALKAPKTMGSRLHATQFTPSGTYVRFPAREWPITIEALEGSTVESHLAARDVAKSWGNASIRTKANEQLRAHVLPPHTEDETKWVLIAARVSDDLGFFVYPPSAVLTVDGERRLVQLPSEDPSLDLPVTDRQELRGLLDYVLYNNERTALRALVQMAPAFEVAAPAHRPVIDGIYDGAAAAHGRARVPTRLSTTSREVLRRVDQGEFESILRAQGASELEIGKAAERLVAMKQTFSGDEPPSEVARRAERRE